MDATMTGPTSALSTQYFSSKMHQRGQLKPQSSFNNRSKGILRFRKPVRKLKTSIENEKQRKGLDSILRTECDVPMTTDSTGLKSVRKIPKTPFKVLDAPMLQDDFYLNLVDWSSTNMLAVGLNGAVYIWSASNQRVSKLCEVPETDAITSVAWAQQGTHLAVGTHSGFTQIWDTHHNRLVRTLSGHVGRVSSIAWNKSIVSTGSRDRNILQRDLRAPGQHFSKMSGHKQEVCGLKWSFDSQQLASGGNDNKLMIWNLHSNKPLVKFHEHTAAVKAIGWSPH
mgnify:FL=1